MSTLRYLFTFFDKVPVARFLSPSLKKALLRLILTSRLANTQKPVLLNGLRFYLPPALVYGYTRRAFDPEVTQELLRSLQPGMKVLDVGANIGYFSLLAAKLVGPQGKVFAVEPGPENLEYLRKNIRTNGFANIEVLPFAAGMYNRTRDFFVSHRGALSSLYASVETEETVQVQEVILDNIIKDQIDLIKLDIEGGEIEALRGMSHLLKSNPSTRLIVEWNPDLLRLANHVPKDLPSFLNSAGFECSILEDNVRHTGLEIGELIKRLQSDGDLFGTGWYSNLLAYRSVSS